VCESAGFTVTGSGGAALSIGCAHAHRTAAKTNVIRRAFMGTSNLNRIDGNT
jgi:shikimate 5-dehydrogenase